LSEGETGFCGARKCAGGISVPLNYGLLTSVALDPIEKKPFARFHPGSKILSAGSFGCNMDCPFCQNHEISRARADEVPVNFVPPQVLASKALSLTSRGNIGLAFTYNEPTVGYEYVRDAARESKKLGLINAVVTNGCVSLSALNEVLPYIDAFNIDLKCFTAGGYAELKGNLDAVMAFITAAAAAAHVEITTLIVPGISDSLEDIKRLSAWVASVDRDIPLHITRFFPRRKMTGVKPTDPELMRTLRGAALENLSDVLLGNI